MKKTLFFIAIVASCLTSCEPYPTAKSTSTSGVDKMNVEVKTNANGHTVEQENIAERYKRDNAVGSIKHLYIMSAYSGQVLIYSTVKGKVTSSGKRLNPSAISSESQEFGHSSLQAYNGVTINGHFFESNELLGDDGTYGNSVEYIYWFDTKGIYHQQYITGGMILHISDQPLAVKSVILNMEQTPE